MSPLETTYRLWNIFAACLVGVGAVLVAAASTLCGQQPATPIKADTAADQQHRQVALRDQLRVGLKAVTKADFAFIDLVIQKVNQGTLPRKLVDSTFLWARNRYKTRPSAHPLRPMVYFQPALVLRAKAIGVRL